MTKQSKVLIFSLLIIPFNAFYGIPAVEWLGLNSPSIYGIVAKTVIVFGPIALFTLVYLNNTKTLKKLNLTKHNDKKTKSFNSKDLQITSLFAITATLFWSAFMIFLAFRQGSSFLSFVK